MNKSDSIAKLAEALSKAQGEMKPAAKDSENPHFRSKYADLASCWDAARGPLTANGLSVVQTCDIPEQGQGVIVETTVAHLSGEFITGRMFVPVAKYDAQGIGSALTYGRRYGFCAAIGMVADDDDDGNEAVGKGKVDNRSQTNTAKKQEQSPASVEAGLSEAQKHLLNELTEICNGDKTAMAELLRECSYFKKQDGKEGWLKLPDLHKPNPHEGFQKWIGATLGKLRAKNERQPGEEG